MNAIKLHGQNSNGIPADWPARRQPLPEGASKLPPDYPAKDGWQLMSDEEFDRYCADRRAQYDAAIEARDAILPTEKTLETEVKELREEITSLKSRLTLTESKMAITK